MPVCSRTRACRARARPRRRPRRRAEAAVALLGAAGRRMSSPSAPSVPASPSSRETRPSTTIAARAAAAPAGGVDELRAPRACPARPGRGLSTSEAAAHRRAVRLGLRLLAALPSASRRRCSSTPRAGGHANAGLAPQHHQCSPARTPPGSACGEAGRHSRAPGGAGALAVREQAARARGHGHERAPRWRRRPPCWVPGHGSRTTPSTAAAARGRPWPCRALCPARARPVARRPTAPGAAAAPASAPGGAPGATVVAAPRRPACRDPAGPPPRRPSARSIPPPTLPPVVRACSRLWPCWPASSPYQGSATAGSRRAAAADEQARAGPRGSTAPRAPSAASRGVGTVFSPRTRAASRVFLPTRGTVLHPWCGGVVHAGQGVDRAGALRTLLHRWVLSRPAQPVRLGDRRPCLRFPVDGSAAAKWVELRAL